MKYRIINVGGAGGGEAYLLISDSAAALFDTGFAFSAARMTDNLKAELGNRPLDFIFLTHSHYDHAGGTPYVKNIWPSAKVVASEYAANVFHSPGAIKVMRELTAAAADCEYEDLLDKITVDIIVNDGDILKLGENTVNVLSLPGHTKCSVGFYIPELRLFVSPETVGAARLENDVVPCCLVGYKMTLDAISRAAELNPDAAIIPHSGLLTGKDNCSEYFRLAGKTLRETADNLLSMHLSGKSQTEMMAYLKEKFYTPDVARIQPLKAFDLNASIMIPMIINELTAAD